MSHINIRPGFAGSPCIEIGVSQTPSWRAGGEGVANLKLHRDGQSGVAIWLDEHYIPKGERGSSKTTHISLTKEQANALHEILGQIIQNLT